MEPQKLSTNFALVDLLVEDSNLREHQPREEDFTKLADVYSMDKQYAEALKHLHQALRLNPDSTEVQHGLERLEKLMRGEDPEELGNSMEQIEQVGSEDLMATIEYVSP
ncbi:hypothetical protein PsorP6_004253 [Peronosclerospora sorghi]|uniref:Uncharacterized protein n=1 Tax=Peronosclerospora sorghi TaxID=230839 RepID=A0ACC0VQP8_9STRA|nr:hypothetical protein PsorP6_004253 [Peronosclerospora sorghi]